MKIQVKVILKNGMQQLMSVEKLGDIETKIEKLGFNKNLIRTIHVLGL